MKPVLFFYGPLKQRLDWAGASLLCSSFASEVGARNWAMKNGVRFVDARFKRIMQREGDIVWQVISRRVAGAIPARLAGDYVGVGEVAETSRDVALRRAEWAKRTMRELCGDEPERENWSAPNHVRLSTWGHRSA
jgi:hypothetical protein